MRQAVRNPLTVARAWAYAAHSVNYRDRRPGAWTSRAAPFVAGAERAAEQRASSGGGGQQWRDIQAKHCAMTLTDLTAVTPSDAPRTATTQVVYLSGTTSLNCADGTQQRSSFAAQTIVERQSNGWHVTTVTH
jgi:hypothetical protein